MASRRSLSEEGPFGQYSFGDYLLDRRAGTLPCGGAEIGLRSKSFDVLAHLVERHGRLVEREELMQAVWPDVEVTDESVTRCIADIRKALSDDAQRLIRTVPRRGYLFAAPVATLIPEPPRSQAAAPEVVTRQPWRSRIKWICAVLAPTLLVAGAFVWRSWRGSEKAGPQRAFPLITLPGLARYPSFSPEGDRVAFTWTGPKQDNTDVYVQQIGAGSPMRLTTDPANDYNPVWSPDGRWIAFLRRDREDASRSELRLIAPLGGVERKLAEIRVPNTYFLIPPYLGWCPDSQCVVVANSAVEGRGTALFAVSLDTGEKTQLTRFEGLGGDTNPAISPDGKWLVFRRQSGGRWVGELYCLSLGPGLKPVGDPQRLTPLELDAGYPAWMPDGEEILFSTEAAEVRGSLWRIAASGHNTPERLPFVGEDGMMPVVSRPQPGRPSRLVYVRSFQDSNIWRIQTPAPGAPASAPVMVISSSRRECVPQLSPDGRRVAFASDRSGTWEIWISDADGSNAVQITFFETAAGAPGWSPDRERIVFDGPSEGRRDLFAAPASGGKPRNLTFHPANYTRPSFSRDGKWIYFTSDRTGERQIWKMPSSGGEAIQVTTNGAFAAFESPDGRYLYYNQTMERPSPLWRVPTSGGEPVKVLDGVVLCAFAVVDQGIYYIDRPSGNGGLLYNDRPSGTTRLQYFNLASRQSTTVANSLGSIYLGLTASKDGRTIFYSRVDSSLDDLMLVENFR
jgi:Tol biopolymer transport system component/DNA-binding winged helix-turn-helix (wHTH) protein